MAFQVFIHEVGKDYGFSASGTAFENDVPIWSFRFLKQALNGIKLKREQGNFHLGLQLPVIIIGNNIYFYPGGLEFCRLFSGNQYVVCPV
jgi:hypothetical protein